MIVDAALALLRSEGLDAVTMRRVADALDTGPASLYVYVSGRDGLLKAMQARISASVPTEPPDPGRWREQLHGLLLRMQRALAAHPGMAAATLGTLPNNEETLSLLEALMGLLLAGGLAPQDAAWTADVLALLVTYAAIEHDARGLDGDGGELAAAAGQAFAALSPERFPLISAYAAELVSGTSDERFRYAIDVVLDGQLSRLTRRRKARP